MADATAFNLSDNQKAERKLLVTAVNVGDSISSTGGSPEWQIVGVGVEDSSIDETESSSENSSDTGNEENSSSDNT